MQSKRNRDWLAVCFVDRAMEQELKKNKSNDGSRDQQSTLDYLIERVTDMYLNTQEFTHCEVAFPLEDSNDENECLAYGVFSDVGVFCKKRTFSNPAYKAIIISLTSSERTKITQFCSMQIGKPFDYQGMRMSPFWPKTTGESSWYCIAFVMAVLHQANILKTYPTGSLDTDELVHILGKHPRVMGGKLPSHLKKNILPIQQSLFNK